MTKQGVQRDGSVANNTWSLLTKSLKTGMIMLIVLIALLVTALAACGNTRNPEEVATAYFEDEKEGNVKDFGELFTPKSKKIVAFVWEMQT